MATGHQSKPTDLDVRENAVPRNETPPPSARPNNAQPGLSNFWMAAGLIAWIAVLWILPADLSGEIDRLILFFVLVLQPALLRLGLRKHRAGQRSHAAVFAAGAWPIAAALLCAGLTFVEQTSDLRVLFAVPWLAMQCSLVAYAVPVLAERGLRPFSEAAIEIAFCLSPVGGVWLMAHLGGFSLLGFEEPWLALTAAHFHYAAVLAPLVIGLGGRRQGGRATDGAAAMLLGGTILTAIGIAGRPWLEIVGALLVTSGICVHAIVQLFFVRSYSWPLLARFIWALSSISLFVPMSMATLFAINRFAPGAVWSLSLPHMLPWHAWWNALAFSGCGVLALLMAGVSDGEALPPGIPFSRLNARGRVGGDWFLRNGLAARQGSAIVPGGLVDRMAVFDRADFQSLQLPATIIRFYEHTADYAMDVRPNWSRGFRLLARLYAFAFGRRFEQMNLPLAAEHDRDIKSEIFALDSAKDGRSSVRAWVRTYKDDGRAIYAAAYSWHRAASKVFMNIAFPVPMGNVTSMLHLEWKNEELSLTTRSPRGGDDRGIYFVLLGRWPVRLPLNETIVVRETEGRLEATHWMWFAGICFLRLDYRMARGNVE